MPLGNIAEEIGLSIQRTKQILKNRDEYLENGPRLQVLKHHDSRDDYIVHLVKEALATQHDLGKSVAEMKCHLEMKHHIKISSFQLHKLMKSRCNLTYVVHKTHEAYVNSAKNIIARCRFAQRLIEQLEKGRVIVNIDESSVNQNIIKRKRWGPKCQYQRQLAILHRFENLTLTLAVTSNG